MRLRQIMAETGTSQQELADAIGVSIQAVNNYVHEKREPNIDTLIKIAEFFSISLDYLTERTNSEIPKPPEPENYVEVNDRTIRLYSGDSVRIHIGDKTLSFTVQEMEI